MPKLLVLGALAVVALVLTGGARAAELDYVERTTGQTISATTAAGADTIVTGATVSYDGTTKVCVEAYVPSAQPAANTAGSVRFVLFEDGTQIGHLGLFGFSSTVASVSHFNGKRCFTPTAGSHTYSLRAYRVAVDVTLTAGSSGSTYVPAFLRVTDESGGGGGPTAWTDITGKPTFNADWLEDVDTTGAIDGTVLKYDEASETWVVATDDASGEGSSGPVTLSAGDRERLDLNWWGVWAIVGLLLVLMIAAPMLSVMRVTRGMADGRG